MMKRHTILLYFALLMPCCGIQAQDTLWVRYDNRFQRNVEQDITNVDSIEVKSSQLRLFSPTATKTVTVTPDKATVMFTNPGRYLLKPNTYSGTNYENQKATQGYNFAHSVESEHFVVFWDVRFGDNPTRIKHPNNGSVANAYNVLDIAERCWDVYVNDLGFQMVETRSCAIIETEQYGLVAMLPVGMSQICSVNWIPELHVGQQLHRGDEMGYFMFGGSDVVMLFQRGVEVDIVHDGNHMLMGEGYAKLRNKN